MVAIGCARLFFGKKLHSIEIWHGSIRCEYGRGLVRLKSHACQLHVVIVAYIQGQPIPLHLQ